MRRIVAALRDGSWVTRRVMVALCATIAYAHVYDWWWQLSGDRGRDPKGFAVGHDFAPLYAGSRALADGAASSLYDLARFEDLSRPWTGDGSYAWFYPPSSFPVFAPLSRASYPVALTVSLLVGLAALLAALWAILPRRGFFALGALSPAVLYAVGYGQSVLLLLAGCFGAGLVLLHRRPLLAGALLGVVAATKPHLAALVPVALLAGRHWRALAGMAGAVGALSLASWVAYGSAPWIAFLASPGLARELLEDGRIPYPGLLSTFAAVRLLGGATVIAYALQAMAAALAIRFVWVAWRGSGSGPGAPAATLLLAALVATPYAFDYDLVLAVLGLAFLARTAAVSGWGPWARTAMAVAWGLPLFAKPVARGAHLGLAPAILLLLLVLAARRARPTSAWAPA